MIFPLIVKSFGISSITGLITQISGYLILYLSKNPLLSILWIQIFGNILAYFAQSYVFGFKKFILSVALRWAIVVCTSLFMCVKTFKYLDSLEKIKEWKRELTGWKLDILNFAVLTFSIMIVFKSNNLEKNNIYDIGLILICGLLVMIDRYLYIKIKS